MSESTRAGPLARLTGALVDQPWIAIVLLATALLGGIAASPFDWDLAPLPRAPVPVDAIPDLAENQQLVFTTWPGRSPQDVEDQVTYPLTVALLGIPGVATIRSSSMFGISVVYVIFEEDVEFYWSRSRILEKLASLPSNTLPDDVNPALGPDATPVGQIFWYTLEGRDDEGNPAGGWDLDELRSIQDWQVRFALQAVPGVSEVASIGGYVREYQIDVNPDAMRNYGVTLAQVYRSVQRSNSEVGARTIEVNRVEYVIRGVGFVASLADLEETVVAARDGVPVRIRDLAQVGHGPALRRGALDKGGGEAVGAVVVARYGANPLATLGALKERIAELAPSLPVRTLADGTRSRVTIVPFYDRSELIGETLETLETALILQILVTVGVVVTLIRHLGISLLIASSLPLAVLATFFAMKLYGIDANIVALSGIAIAIGTMVDMSVIVCENIYRRLSEADPSVPRHATIRSATQEVSGAVVTAVATTVVSFVPVFALEREEGRLFHPLAYAKTFALLAAVVIALGVLPMLAGIVLRARCSWRISDRLRRAFGPIDPVQALVWVGLGIALVATWRPLGEGFGWIGNGLVLLPPLACTLALFSVAQRVYPRFVRWGMASKGGFFAIPAALVAFGLLSWQGAFVPDALARTAAGRAVADGFPGLGSEFMPALDEGSFLYMPSTMPHASIGEALDVLAKIDRAIESLPEVDLVVGKLGRADTALDTAPISMIETIVHYKPEYARRADGTWVRQWPPEVRSPEDIWDRIVAVAALPGTTSAPMLQPIETRRIMLQSGMRSPLGLELRGPSLSSLEQAGVGIERVLRGVPEIDTASVFADRIVGKPYLEIRVDRPAIARHGLTIRDVHDVIEVAVGGRPITMTVEGRERYPVRVRYPTELRDRVEALAEVLIPTSGKAQIPLGEIATVEYVRGPQVIKSEDGFLLSYVLFAPGADLAEGQVVDAARSAIERAIASGALTLPEGVSYRFGGTYESQERSAERLRITIPIVLALIFLLLYLQFRSTSLATFVFAGVFVAWAGGFVLMWLYGRSWFLDVGLLGANLRDVFHIEPQHLSVAIWVGFIALFGIATDDGVVIGTYLQQEFRARRPGTVAEIRETVLRAVERRVRPMLITTATTVLALLPVLSSRGRGSDIMIPMAIPAFGGMLAALLSVALVPVLYATREEWRLSRRRATDSS